MALNRDQAIAHRTALALLAKAGELTWEERETVLDCWHEGASVSRPLDGAFFTPGDLAADLHLEIIGERVLDLCAGIGRLAYHARDRVLRSLENLPPREVVCVEKNPAYVEVGRRVLPEATWICADVLDLPDLAEELGRFDTVIANPPFGRLPRGGRNGGAYRGPWFEYHVIAAAAPFARRGVFILPQRAVPYRSSGRTNPLEVPNEDHDRFRRETGLELRPGLGLDTTCYTPFRDASVVTEVAVCTYPDPAGVAADRTSRAQAPAVPPARPTVVAAARPAAAAPSRAAATVGPAKQLDLFG